MLRAVLLSSCAASALAEAAAGTRVGERTPAPEARSWEALARVTEAPQMFFGDANPYNVAPREGVDPKFECAWRQAAYKCGAGRAMARARRTGSQRSVIPQPPRAAPPGTARPCRR